MQFTRVLRPSTTDGFLQMRVTILLLTSVSFIILFIILFYNTGDYTPFLVINFWLCFVYIYCHTPNLTSLSTLEVLNPSTNKTLVRCVPFRITGNCNPHSIKPFYVSILTQSYFVIYLPVVNHFTIESVLAFVFQIYM